MVDMLRNPVKADDVITNPFLIVWGFWTLAQLCFGLF